MRVQCPIAAENKLLPFLSSCSRVFNLIIYDDTIIRLIATTSSAPFIDSSPQDATLSPRMTRGSFRLFTFLHSILKPSWIMIHCNNFFYCYWQSKRAESCDSWCSSSNPSQMLQSFFPFFLRVLCIRSVAQWKWVEYQLFYGLEVTTKRLKRGFSFLAEIDYEDDDIECNLPLLDGAALSATSSLNERGPENARLNGESTVSSKY